MNLSDITAKAWILALFIRDDGQRFLLGDGWFDFKDSLQHFQPNSIANDIVELQGADGQLLAGQVRRSGTQNFDGYIGDASATKTDIETRRRNFLAFFQIRHKFKVVYIFPDGKAIQRQRGYLVDAPTASEMWQFFPEYHVALSFEDVPYYEYSEDSSGNETYAHTLSFTALTAVTHIGAAFKYTDRSVAYPATVKWQPWGSTLLAGTPSPSTPAQILAVTGQQEILYASGKNLLRPRSGYEITHNDVVFTWLSSGAIQMVGTASAATSMKNGAERENYEVTLPAGDYTFSASDVPAGCEFKLYKIDGASFIDIASDTQQQFTLTGVTRIGIQVNVDSGTVLDDTCYLQIEEGSDATDFESWTGKSHTLNFGKNLQGGFSSNVTITRFGITFINNADGTVTVNAGTCTGSKAMSLYGSEARNNGRTFWLSKGTYVLSGGTDKISLTLGDMNGVELGTTDSTGSVTVTLTKTVSAFVRADVDVGVTVDATTIRPLLERGTYPTEYMPYFAPVELNLIGGVSDHIYRASNNVDWYIEKRTCKTTLDGTEAGWGWNSGVSAPFITCADAGLDGFTSSTKGMFTKVCDHFEYHATTPGSSSPDGLYEDGDAYTSKLFFKHNASASLADFKTWLGSHPITVYSVRPSATNVLVTDTQLKVMMRLAGVGPSPVAMVSSVSSPGTAPLGNSLRFYSNANEKTLSMNTELPSYPVWTIEGPMTGPIELRNANTDETMIYNTNLSAGDKVVIDAYNKTVIFNDQVNEIALFSGEWMSISNGDIIAFKTANESGTSKIEWNGVVE